MSPVIRQPIIGYYYLVFYVSFVKWLDVIGWRITRHVWTHSSELTLTFPPKNIHNFVLSLKIISYYCLLSQESRYPAETSSEAEIANITYSGLVNYDEIVRYVTLKTSGYIKKPVVKLCCVKSDSLRIRYLYKFLKS